MKKLFIGFFLIILSSPLYSQNPIWILPPNSMNIQTQQLSPLPINPDPIDNYFQDPYDYYDGIPANHSSNGIANLDGQLKFFIIDGLIYDKDGRFLDYAWAVNVPDVVINIDDTYFVKGNGGTETLIIPHPTNCEQFYLIGAGVQEGTYLNSGPIYALYDHCQKVVVKRGPWYSNHDIDWGTNNVDEIFNMLNSEINGDLPFVGISWGEEVNGRGLLSLAASKLQSDGSRFIVCRMGTRIVIIKIYSNGNLGYWKRYLMPYFSDYPTVNRCEMELVQDNVTGEFTLVFANRTSNFNDAYMIQIMKFDQDFLNVTQPADFVVLPTDQFGIESPVHGVEFSPDQSKLFFSITPNAVTQNELYFVDLSQTNPTAQELGIDLSLPMEYSQIEIGIDGKLYFGSNSGLFTLSNPNNPSSNNFSQSPSIPFVYTPTFSCFNNQNYRTRAYSLPDQVDEMDYSSIFENNLQCCIDNRTYHAENYESSETGTWLPGGASNLISILPNQLFVKKELRIKAGSVLTIKDMVILFAPGARLVVENGDGIIEGAKLILNNTLLTIDDRCDPGNNLWLGVEVWGNQTVSQGIWSNSSQGRFEMINGSKIEHAFIGTLVGKRQSVITEICPGFFDEVISTFAFDDARNGGIIKITESNYEQNQRGIRFRKYIDPNGLNNLSVITRSNFDWIAPLLGNFSIQSHLMMEDVKGIKVEGSSFNNSILSGLSQSGQGIGILSRSSQFSVNRFCPFLTSLYGDCPGLIKTSFNDLQFGIHATNSTDNLTYSVDNSEFTNCTAGIHTIGTQNERINKNTFFIRETTLNTVGISLFNSSGYTVMENFLRGSTTPGQGQTFGIVVENSGTAPNMIYKNTFLDLMVGGYSLKTNGSTVNASNFPNFMPATGLKWKCNNFKTPLLSHDLAVNGKIDYNQGYAVNFNLMNVINSTSGNTFSINNGTDPIDHDILMVSGSQPIRYVHFSEIGHVPDYYTANMVAPIQATFLSLPISSQNKACPSKLGKQINVVMGDVANALDQLNELKSKIDQGNALTLLNLINSGTNPVEIKNALLEKSPFLSDTILLTYLASPASSGMKKDVLTANAHLTEIVINAVMNSSLPIGTKNQILNAQNGVSQRDLVLMEIDHLNSESSQDYNEVLSRLLLDSTANAGYTETINFLNTINDSRSKKVLVDIYLSKNDQQNMTTIKSELMSELDEPDYFVLQDIKEQLRPQPAVEYAFENIVGIETQVEGLANNSGNIHVKAKSKTLLEFRDGHSDLPDFLPLFASSAMMLNQTEEGVDTEFKIQQVVSIYPNPSTGDVYFDYPELGEGILTIKLLDVNGKEVYSYNSVSESNGERVDLSHIKKGFYLVQINIDGQFIEMQKLLLK